MEIGFLMMRLGRLDNARAAFDMALALRPGYVAALEGLCLSLFGLNRYEESLPKILELRAAAPAASYVDGSYLHAQLQCCAWSEFDSQSRAITVALEQVELWSEPVWRVPWCEGCASAAGRR